MAGLRRGIAYRKVVRAYTRRSKFKKKGFIKSIPNPKIVKYDMGDDKKNYECRVDLISKDKIQIRHNAIESARLIVNRKLNEKFGNTGYFLKIRLYPHHVLRENKMLTGAGSDRMQTGMQKAFGKVVGIAAQVKKNQILMSAYVNKNQIDTTRKILKTASPKLPCKCGVVINEIKSD